MLRNSLSWFELLWSWGPLAAAMLLNALPALRKSRNPQLAVARKASAGCAVAAAGGSRLDRYDGSDRQNYAAHRPGGRCDCHCSRCPLHPELAAETVPGRKTPSPDSRNDSGDAGRRARMDGRMDRIPDMVRQNILNQGCGRITLYISFLDRDFPRRFTTVIGRRHRHRLRRLSGAGGAVRAPGAPAAAA